MQTQTISKTPRKMRIEAIQGKQIFEEIDRLDNIARDAWAFFLFSIIFFSICRSAASTFSFAKFVLPANS